MSQPIRYVPLFQAVRPSLGGGRFKLTRLVVLEKSHGDARRTKSDDEAANEGRGKGAAGRTGPGRGRGRGGA